MAEDDLPHLKLILNRAALEKLIGNDQQIEILMSHNAVKSVIGKHMKQIEDKVDQAASKLTGRVLDEAIARVLGKVEKARSVGGVDKFVPSDYLLSAMAKALESVVIQRLNELVAEHLMNIEDTIKRIADTYGKGTIERRAKEMLMKAASGQDNDK